MPTIFTSYPSSFWATAEAVSFESVMACRLAWRF